MKKNKIEKLVEQYPELWPYTYYLPIGENESVLQLTAGGEQILHDLKRENK